MASAAVNSKASGSVVVVAVGVVVVVVVVVVVDVDSFLVDTLIVCGFFVGSLFCYVEIIVLYSSVTILSRKRELSS